MRRTVPIISLATAAALLLGCEQAPAPTAPAATPSAAATVSQSQTVTPLTLPPLTNQCTGETIVFTGAEMTTRVTITDAAGATRTIFIDLIRASGVSDAGKLYQATLVSPAVVNVTAGGTFTTTVPVRLRIISQGSGQNVTLDALTHITEVNGVRTAFVDSFSQLCLF